MIYCVKFVHQTTISTAMHVKLVILVLFSRCALGKLDNIVEDEHNSIEDSGDTKSKIGSYLNSLKFIQKLYQDCSRDDVSTCLKIKLVGMMDSFIRTSKETDLINGVSFVKDPTVAVTQPVSLSKIEANLPRNLEEKENKLNSIILDKFLDFFQSHKLQIKLPTMSDLEETESEEGRGRRRRNGLFMVPLIIAGTLVPMALGGLALFAGKALLVSKLALVLAIIIGLKKLLGGHENEKPHEIYIPPHDSGHSRSYTMYDPHKLVYKAYVTK